jgi:hypothetical protein
MRKNCRGYETRGKPLFGVLPDRHEEQTWLANTEYTFAKSAGKPESFSLNQLAETKFQKAIR